MGEDWNTQILWYTSVIRILRASLLLVTNEFAMVNYYDILKISPDATTAQIKSAYRKLARKKHPDLNKGNEVLAREFAGVTVAYRVLVDPKQRANYDRRRLRTKFEKEGSIFDSDNKHARRVRQMAYERRYNAIIDRMIEEERNESLALQRIIFPVVALFISTVFVAIFKPQFWSHSSSIGKIVLVGLFVVGIVHFARRFKDAMDRYTYSGFSIHDSVINEIEEDARPYSRVTAFTFLIAGIGLSLGIGLAIGNFLGIMNEAMNHGMFSQAIRPELMFYPPIVVLLVDGVHSLVAKFEY